MVKIKYLMITCMLMVLFSSTADASSLPTPTPVSPRCNADIMTAVQTRAWLEAQREIAQNQNLIAKPDSVLEYSCFDSFLNKLALDASDTMFSENTAAWSGGSIPPSLINDTSLDNDLQQYVGLSTLEYINKNFDHTFLGGRSSEDNTMAGISGAAYACDRMSAVWMAAKCHAFAEHADEDGFMTFKQTKDNDPRQFPAACTNLSSMHTKFDAFMENTFIEFGTSTKPTWLTETIPVGASTSTAETVYNDTFTKAGEYDTPALCDDAHVVYTGFMVYDFGKRMSPPFAGWPDAVCSNPGCYVAPLGPAGANGVATKSKCVPLP